MVLGSWLVVPGVLEVGSVGVGHVEWHVGISIIDTVQFLTVEELAEVVLNDWALSKSGVHGSSGLSLDGITPSEDVFVS